MGLLTEGKPLSWEETKALAEHVRQHGIQQFINIYHRLKDRQGDVLKWGDEVEYIIVKFDNEKKIARVSCKALELLTELNKKERDDPENVKALWRPEYGAYMIEGTPGKPFGGLMAHLNMVEANMRYRREEVTELLDEDECVMSITNFPRLGCQNFTHPLYKPKPDESSSCSRSLYLPDEIIYPGHPRFKNLTRNIRMRRGEKVAIRLKVYMDENTLLPIEGSPPNEPDVVMLDAMGFGMGCCCLQLTFQACNITEARTLYDQLAPLCPIMLALTAASPIYRGYLTESDCRWNVISSSVDCRTPEERGLKPLKENQFRISKSRYDSIDCYLSPENEKYNDVSVTYDHGIYKCIREGGIDHLLAQHVAHLFIRDTVSLFSEKVHQNDAEDSDHFENIQSTNWQTMRFKPPPPNSAIGWRVEFRPCEAQISDFENAAFVCFVVLLTRVILSYQLNFLVPISKVDENMQTAQKRNACRQQKFWFRKNVRKQLPYSNGTCPPEKLLMNNANSSDIVHGKDVISRGLSSKPTNAKALPTSACADDDINYKCKSDMDEYELMTIGDIFNGKPDVFPGLVPLIRSYLQSMEVDTDTHCTIEQYLRFIQKRASGELLTTAAWMRKQVLNHPDYKKDSIVSDRINYDILKKIEQIQNGKLIEPDLLGYCNRTKTKDFIPAAIKKHLNGCCESK